MVYKCSKCGEYNLLRPKIPLVSETMKPDSFKRSQMKAEVEAELRNQNLNRLIKILQKIENRQFDSTNLRCKCAKCGHKEPWARMPLDFEAYPKPLRWLLMGLLLFVGILIVLALGIENLSSTGGMILGGVIMAGVLAGIPFLWFKWKEKVRSGLELEIARLSPENLPIVLTDGEKARELVEKLRQSASAA